MANSRGSVGCSSRGPGGLRVDPFDIEWIQDDPLGRDVMLRKSTVSVREAIAKHRGDEYLHSGKIRDIIEDPARIDLTETNPRHTEIYYTDTEDEPYPYGRAVVRFDDDDHGEVISWSRYRQHVSLIDIVYEKPEDKS